MFIIILISPIIAERHFFSSKLQNFDNKNTKSYLPD